MRFLCDRIKWLPLAMCEADMLLIVVVDMLQWDNGQLA